MDKDNYNVVFQKFKVCHHCGAKDLQHEAPNPLNEQEEDVGHRASLPLSFESVGVQVGKPHYIDSKSKHIFRNKANFGYLKERIENTINND